MSLPRRDIRMSLTQVLGEPWEALANRLDQRAVLARWAAGEPVLSAFRTVHDLAAAVNAGGDHVDNLLAALVRLAAADGGDDEDAVLVLLHLLGPGARLLADQLKDLSTDSIALVLGELTLQIRQYPWRR